MMQNIFSIFSYIINYKNINILNTYTKNTYSK